MPTSRLSASLRCPCGQGLGSSRCRCGRRFATRRAYGPARRRVLGAAAPVAACAGRPSRLVFLSLVCGGLRLGAALPWSVRRGRAVHMPQVHGWRPAPARSCACRCRGSSRHAAFCCRPAYRLSPCAGDLGQPRAGPGLARCPGAAGRAAPVGRAVLVGDAPGINRRAAELLPQARTRGLGLWLPWRACLGAAGGALGRVRAGLRGGRRGVVRVPGAGLPGRPAPLRAGFGLLRRLRLGRLG